MLGYVIAEMTQEIKNHEDGKIENKDTITLIHFFEKFKKNYDKLEANDLEPVEKELEEINKILLETKKQKEIQEKKLGDKFDTIKRLGLKIEMLENEETPSYFRKRYDSLNQNERENTLLLEIKSLERKIKYFPFGKSGNQSLLQEKQLELKKIQEAKSQAEEFENLSDEDKKQIIEYLLLDKEELHLIRRKGDEESKCFTAKSFPMQNKRCSKTLEKMLNEGEISDKDLEEIFKKLEKVKIKASKSEYPWGGRRNGRAEDCFDVICWFIKNVYEKQDKPITVQGATKNALQTGVTSEQVAEAKDVKEQEEPKNIKEGVTKDD